MILSLGEEAGRCACRWVSGLVPVLVAGGWGLVAVFVTCAYHRGKGMVAVLVARGRGWPLLYFLLEEGACRCTCRWGRKMVAGGGGWSLYLSLGEAAGRCTWHWKRGLVTVFVAGGGGLSLCLSSSCVFTLCDFVFCRSLSCCRRDVLGFGCLSFSVSLTE